MRGECLPGRGKRCVSPAGGFGMDELKACLALRHTKGLGARTWKRLLVQWGSAAEAVSHCKTWSARGLAPARVQAEFQSGSWRPKAESEERAVRATGCKIVFWEDYPECLRQISDPPLCLYCLGDESLLTRPCVAVVGSRQASNYGLGMAGTIARDLGRAGICVVSGMAQGIDAAAHSGALEGPGSTIAVLGTGIDLVYPASNVRLREAIAERGLLVSEFSPGTRPEGPNFPHRNRIVSGLSLGVLVVEGALGSGSLVTAGLALRQNREVFALPGPANLKTYQGCHRLIREGACLVQSAEDILYELGPRLAAEAFVPAKLPTPPETAPSTPEDPEHAELHGYLSAGPLHIDELVRLSGWSAEKVSAALLFMELQGLVKQLPGMYYSVCG